MNVGDSTWLGNTLRSRGWTPAPEEEARVFLVNTCSVREKPEQKVYSLLGRIRHHWERDPSVFVGVGGCVAQQMGTSLWERFPFVRLVFGTDGVAMVPDALERLVSEPRLHISLLDFLDHYPERTPAAAGTGQTQAFVNIMQGCDNFCAYCIVPYTRGRQKSRSSRAVLDECRDLVAGGAREITLLGQNVNSFGQDRHGDGTRFAQLLEQVCDLPGLERVRFTTSHPKDIDPEVIAAFGRLDKLCPHLHLPLQSGSNRVLGVMGRKYTRDDYLGIVDKLRRARPGIVLTTDLIVGFPGETEQDFEATMQTVRGVCFDSSYSFKYSDRPGVRAARMEPKVPEEVKAERLHQLQQLQEDLTTRSLERLVGAEVTVLVEGPSPKQGRKNSQWRGKEPGGRVVNLESPEPVDLSGLMTRTRITAAKKHSVSGEVIGRPC